MLGHILVQERDTRAEDEFLSFVLGGQAEARQAEFVEVVEERRTGVGVGVEKELRMIKPAVVLRFEAVPNFLVVNLETIGRYKTVAEGGRIECFRDFLSRRRVQGYDCCANIGFRS